MGQPRPELLLFPPPSSDLLPSSSSLPVSARTVALAPQNQGAPAASPIRRLSTDRSTPRPTAMETHHASRGRRTVRLLLLSLLFRPFFYTEWCADPPPNIYQFLRSEVLMYHVCACLCQLEEIRQKRAAERMQHAPQTAASHVEPYGWYILRYIAHFISIHCDFS